MSKGEAVSKWSQCEKDYTRTRTRAHADTHRIDAYQQAEGDKGQDTALEKARKEKAHIAHHDWYTHTHTHTHTHTILLESNCEKRNTNVPSGQFDATTIILLSLFLSTCTVRSY